MRKFFLLSITLFIIGNSSFAQATPNPADYSKTIDIIPPAPNAASLGQYGGIAFGLSTGTISSSIPVYNYSSANISLPISISYNSNGLKVDEIGSRVGMSWALNAGGVITRIVYGKPDETGVRIKPPADFPAYTTALITFMDALANSDGVADAQPDLFSFNFNGHSGQFILDSSQNAILLSHEDLKIETNLDSVYSTFKIITADGIQYFFGGDSAVETTSKTNLGSGCGRPSFTGAPTAFYLKKVVHPNNDTVNFVYSRFGFTYKTGTTETIYNRNLLDVEQCPGGITPPTFSNSTCVSIYTTSGVLLEQINSASGGVVKFSYTTRLDVGDKLLSKIEICQPSNVNPFKVFSFNYQNSFATNFLNSYSISDATLKYRPFLIKFIERSPDSSLTRVYQFAYSDMNGLPPRLSFAQDDYGIFNGKNNSTLIPKPAFLVWQDYLPQANANRVVDPVYGIKGLLNKIIYPTGGTDTIIYESNTIYTSVPVPLPDSTVFATINSGPLGGPPDIAYSDTAVITAGQETYLYASCVYTGLPNEYDPIHCTGTVEVVDLTTSFIVYNSNLSCGNTLTPPIISLVSGHSYRIKITAGGHYSEVSASMAYKYGTQTYQMANKEVGGLRVKKVITTDSVSLIPSIKKYIYADLSTQNQSSGGIIYQPRYDKYLKAYVNCPGGSFPSCDFGSFSFYSMFSYSQNNVYAYSSAPVSYSSVIESFGENFENGGIEHKYTVFPDDQGTSVFGDDILAAQGSSNAWHNGREYYQQVFKKIGVNYIPVKKIYTYFKDDARIDTTFTGYTVNKKYTPICESNPPDQIQMNAYNLFKNHIFRKWSYVDTVRTLTYDNAGQSFLEDTTITIYANTAHALPTKVSTRGSDQKLNVINNYYPQDLTLTGPEETARQALIVKHITSPVLQVQVLEDTAQMMKAKINYSVFANGLVLPKEQYVQTLYNVLEKRIEFYKYNANGKLLEQAKASDVRLSYIWDHKSLYPVAECRNADSSQIAYTSFEADSKGYWTYSGSVSLDSTSPTGGKCYLVSGGSLTRAGLINTTYIVSYWGKNGSVNVNSLAPTRTGKTIGNWTYYEHEVTTTSLTVSGSNYIDELRLYPKVASVITYTYTPLIGITSQCDANNRITYYQYDSISRLKLILDQDKKILKKICYNYAGQAESCEGIVYMNVVKNGNFTRNNCGAGYTGSTVTYTVPAGTYSSTISQAAADQLAQNDVNANGQAYANTNGTCTPLTVYARIELTDIYNDVDYSSANVWIKFYSDVACTVSVSVSGLNVNYKRVRTNCGGGSPITTNYTANNCSGTQVLLGNYLISEDDGIHCYNYAYSTTAGTGYVPK